MFSDLHLDDRSYREIEEEAVFHIPGEYPDWTNYNFADPGRTLVQLFSWLTEVQQYRLSQPDERKRRKYLKLFGEEVRHSRPSAGAVCVEPGLPGEENVLPLLKGSRFFAEDLVFETTEKRWIHPVRLLGACLTEGAHFNGYQNVGNDFGKRMRLYPFGEQPRTGNQCCFLLDQGLSPTRETEFYFEIRTEYEVTRNPAGEGFLPLAKWKWEFYGAGGWRELPLEQDETYVFLQSGCLRFRVPEEMAEEETLHVYQIRVTLLEQELDVAPLIENVYLNEIPIRQQYSVCDYEEGEVDFSGEPVQEETFFVYSDLYLAERGQTELYLETGEGWQLSRELRREKTGEERIRIWFSRPVWARGRLRYRLAAFERDAAEKRIPGRGNRFANQEFALPFSHVLYGAFEILVYDREKKAYMDFQKTEDFDVCSARDRVYMLDTAEKRLVFGDCENAMAPDGEIRIIRLKCSQGSAGNCKAGGIRECEGRPELLIRQYRNTEGGRDEETVSECMQRFRSSLKEIHRGVTYADYEELVKKTPGLLILDSRVLPPAGKGESEDLSAENQISIVVQPLGLPGEHTVLSRKYRQNISRFLERRKMLGTRIRILDPGYIGISLYAEVWIRPQFADAREQIERAVAAYLDEKTWEIGKPVLCSALYGLLDTLPCVRKVRTLTVSGQGKGCRYLADGDVGLPPNGLACLKEFDLRLMVLSEEIRNE